MQLTLKASATLHFQLPEPAKIATVTEDGHRTFDVGDYTITFSRGHGDVLEATVLVTAAVAGAANGSNGVGAAAGIGGGGGGGGPVVLSTFPSQFVEGHEVVVDSCIEGTSVRCSCLSGSEFCTRGCVRGVFLLTVSA
jgi:hypothetical protein